MFGERSKWEMLIVGGLASLTIGVVVVGPALAFIVADGLEVAVGLVLLSAGVTGVAVAWWQGRGKDPEQ